MAQKLKTLIITAVIFLTVGWLFMPSVTNAATCSTNPDGTLNADCCPTTGVSQVGPNAGKACKKDPAGCPSGQIDPKDDTKCVALGNSCNQKTGVCKTNPIIGDLQLILNVLAALVGVAVVGTIILGGVQLSAAGAKPEAIAAAKTRIINGLLALAAFLFLYAFLQWLIPGGPF